jgi:divalent metal cation (Fe/Co/Zn/Cd) transporter
MNNDRLYSHANYLAIFTIVYNLVEGVVSMGFGASDETLSLFGFGVDSFIEVMSAFGVWHMIRRIRQNGGESRDEFERRALTITGAAFYLLTAGLVLGAALALWEDHAPVTTFWGVVVSLASLSFMGYLIHEKTKVGKALNSQAILADAACSRACLYLSLVLLLSSLGYYLTGFGKLDALGALGIAWFAFREGREAFQKARGQSCGCSCCGT